MSLSKVKTSKIWNYYNISAENISEAKCKLCKLTVKRGGKTSRSFSTTNLLHHLKRHPKEYQEFRSSSSRKNEGKPSLTSASEETELCDSVDADVVSETQRDISECFELQKNKMKWPSTHPKAVAIHRKIAEMISIDSEPFSIVENVGFRRLLHHLAPQYEPPSRRLITDEVCERLHAKLETAVQSALNFALLNCKPVSLTTDIWSASHTPVSLISLTVHWISDYERKQAMLNAFPLGDESHTAIVLGQKMTTLLTEWGIAIPDVHLMLRDNASNISKACADIQIESRGCFLHTLQLVVKDGLSCQRAVGDILAKCRSVVGHFKHSTIASSKLKNYQKLLGNPEHRLIQDEATRWDSTFYMCERLHEQRKALVAYQCDNDSLNLLTSHQWNLLERIIRLLSPFQQVTKECSSESSSVGDIIPCVELLKKALNTFTDDSGVQTMKEELVKSLMSRFSDVEQHKKLVLATLLDPRYKNRCFASQVTISKSKDWLLTEVRARQPVPCDQPQAAPARKGNIFDFLSELTRTEDLGNIENDLSLTIVQKYLEEPIIPRKQQGVKTCPLKYWKEQALSYPTSPLPPIACVYLSAPCSSIQSERLFSLASGVYTDQRSRLLPEKAEKLLFIKCNFSLL